VPPTSTFQLQYDSSIPNHFIGDASTFFSSSDYTNCPIASCSLFMNDCLNTPTFGVTFGTALDGWSIRADRTIIAGYSI